MARSSEAMAKKSLVVDESALRLWTRIGGFRNQSEAVRRAIEQALAIRQMQDAIARLQRRGTFGRRLA